MRSGKYNAKRHEVDGVVFASKKEAVRFRELKLLEAGSLITSLRLQPSFVLQPAFRDATGKTQRAIKYQADFAYMENGREVIEEVKGYDRNRVWQMKHKMFLYCYPEKELRIIK